jgi:hypothetical protein
MKLNEFLKDHSDLLHKVANVFETILDGLSIAPSEAVKVTNLIDEIRANCEAINSAITPNKE